MRIAVGGTAERPVIERAGLLRTARILFDGIAFPRMQHGHVTGRR